MQLAEIRRGGQFAAIRGERSSLARAPPSPSDAPALDMHFGHPPKVTVRYAGKKRFGRQADGKIWFAVDGQAVISREQQLRADTSQFNPELDLSADAAVSLYGVHSAHSSVDDRGHPGTAADDSAASTATKAQSSLLLRAAQASPTFAAATALSPGIHILCYLSPSRADGGAGGGKPASMTSSLKGRWAALLDDVRAGTGPAEEAERVMWQTPCLNLLSVAGVYLGSDVIVSLAGSGTPSQGWAIVPCALSDNLACLLARGGRQGDGGGRVAWMHLAVDIAGKEAAARGAALAEDLLLTSDNGIQPSFASVSARKVGGSSEVEIVTAAHRVLSDGALSGYDPSLAPPNAPLEPNGPSFERFGEGERSGGGQTSVDGDALFVDDSAASADDGWSWRGAVTTEELPGGGLHRHVRVKVDARCAGGACHGIFGEKDAGAGAGSALCELLLAQHVPQGAYIDVDEVKARHDFDVRPSLPTGRRVGVETFADKPIDIELPSSVSGQHLVNFNLWVDVSSQRDSGREGEVGIRAEMTLPVHLRYPDPGCERRGEDCEEYAWVEVPPPLASIRCGGAGGEMGSFSPVIPFVPPVGASLRVPRGIAWHKDFVMWGTVIAAALGCLLTISTLLAVNPISAECDSGRKRR